MPDKLFHTPVIGLMLTGAGVSTTTDNYANSIRGSMLHCADAKETIELQGNERNMLYLEIGQSNLKDFVPDGVTEVISGLSPLQFHCYQHYGLKGRHF